IGGLLRFVNLGASEMTPDEAASWAAAAAPTVADVIRRQAVLNPGKLAAYELVLHGWIGLFGSDVTAMRTLSAMLGIVAIALVFWVARELLALAGCGKRVRSPGVIPDGSSTLCNGRGEQSAVDIDYAAALSALIFAVTLTMIRFARESRMYPLLIAALLAETGFLLRAHRRGAIANYAAVSLFTAVAIAANFNAVFTIAAQGLWLLLSREGRRGGIPYKPLAALALGAAALLPVMAGAVASSVGAMDKGALDWIAPPRPSELFSFFNRGTGTLPFPVLLALAAWGVVSQWSRLRDAIIFALFWMYGPVILLYVMSLTVTPLLVERYALSSFVPFFILAAVGIAACNSRHVRAGAIALTVALSIGHAAPFLLKPPSLQWRHAADLIRRDIPNATIAVAPSYGANVLIYYLPQSDRYVVTGLTADSCARSALLLLWDHALEGPSGKQAQACRVRFPRVIFTEKDLSVLSR
ncbi:MAG TPA: hypothetical protein VN754_00740, partial [Candidatus Binataceae bacterium]|nr:hypothetical protein [Candidatus Binataceae bacterium]